jgi:nucleoside-diphosphate-sugar epimerase
MSNVVITGGMGLLGSRAVQLLRASHAVHAIVREQPAAPLEGVSYHVMDLAQAWSTEGLPSTTDAVFHLAQSRQFRAFPEGALETYAVNTAATAILLDYAVRAGARRFVLASTGGLYGACADTITEDAPLAPSRGPLEHYFNTKRCAEILSAGFQSHLDVTVLRPFFIYGAGQTPDKLVSRLVESVAAGQAIQMVGEQGASMNPVHVDDAAELLHATLTLAGSQTINVAGPQIVTVRSMAERIGEVLSLPVRLAVTPGQPEHYVADARLFQRLLARPLVSFDDGIRAVLAGRGVRP